MRVDWAEPSLLQIAQGNATWEASENVYQLPIANQWVYWVIDTQLGIPHPIHVRNVHVRIVYETNTDFVHAPLVTRSRFLRLGAGGGSDV
jgi:hypothetical protein